ncbi:MAG: PilZ domain-containing protein [bacterium]
MCEEERSELQAQLEGLRKENIDLKEEIKYLKDQLGKRQSLRQEINIKVVCETQEGSFICYGKNISEGGVFLETNKGFEIGTEVILTLEFFSNNKIDLKSQVVWTGSDGMGLRFEDNPDNLDRLRNILYNLDELRTIIYR